MDIEKQYGQVKINFIVELFINVSILGEELDVPKAPEKAKKTKKDSSTISVKAHKAQSCYHIEYKLFPEDTATVKVDLVVFGPVAKLYREDEFKVSMTWCTCVFECPS